MDDYRIPNWCGVLTYVPDKLGLSILPSGWPEHNQEAISLVGGCSACAHRGASCCVPGLRQLRRSPRPSSIRLFLLSLFLSLFLRSATLEQAIILGRPPLPLSIFVRKGGAWQIPPAGRCVVSRRRGQVGSAESPFGGDDYKSQHPWPALVMIVLPGRGFCNLRGQHLCTYHK